MKVEFPCAYNFYGDIKNDTLPHNYDTFIQLISGKFNFSPDESKQLFYEIETNKHEFKQITESNFENLSDLNIVTIYIYLSEDELKSKKNQKEKNPDLNKKENEEDKKIIKDQVIENIVLKIKKLREMKLKQEKEKENKQLNSIEDLITKKIKDLTAELVKETNMGVSTILENSKFERIKEFEDKKENRKICVSIHNGIICNGCNMNPIKGLRFKCSICPQFNYCQKCEMKFGELHKHPLIKLRFEI